MILAEEHRPIAALIGTIGRAIRALGYYDSAHPVFVQSQHETLAAFHRAKKKREVLTLAGADRKIFVDEEGTAIEDEPAVLLARRMFKLSILAIHIRASARSEDFGELLKVLAESPDRVRDAGGAQALLEKSGVREVDLVDVDFGELFAGEKQNLLPLTGGDPIVELALREVLRLKADEQAEGEALGISFDKLGTVESLGSFLDELLDHAGPGVLEEPREKKKLPKNDAFGELSGDELADLAARAFITNHGRMKRDAIEESELSAGARILGDALVRLAPEARFALLRRLAGEDDAHTPEERGAVAELAKHVGSSAIVEAVASALFDQSGDAGAVRAVGNLIRRLRPIEAGRRKLLQDVDREMEKRKKRLDGVLWFEIRSRALEDSALGMLEIDLASKKAELSARTRNRISGRYLAVEGEQILRSRGAARVDAGAALALAEVLVETRSPQPPLVEAIRETIDTIEQGGEPSEASMTLFRAVLRRADDDPEGALARLSRELLTGDRGAERTVHLARSGGANSRMMGEILLRAMEGQADRAFKDQVFQRLASFDHELLKDLGSQVEKAEPQRVQNLLRIAMAADRKLGIKIVRGALKNSRGRSKDHAVRALASAPDGEGLGLLAMIAGWKGEKTSRALLHLAPGGDSEKRLNELQLAAIDTLGWSRSALAIEPLKDFLLKGKLLPSKHLDDMRAASAQALANNGTPEARAVLEEGLASKKRSIRELCERALQSKRESREKKS
jgi:hypothetical protein